MAKKEQGSSIEGLPYPSDILKISKELGLPPSERHLLLLLQHRMNKKNRSCWPGQDLLADEMGMSRRQVIRLIQSVTAKRIISVNKKMKGGRHRNNHNEYTFNYPWKAVKSDKSKVASMSQVRSDICDKSKVISETVTSDVKDCQKCHPCHPNSKRNNKRISKSSIVNGNADDDSASSIGLKEFPEEMKSYYLKIPKVDLTGPCRSGKRYDLISYFRPFTGSGKDLRKRYGIDYSGSDKPKWWEREFDKFYEKIIEWHWDTGSKPNGGFRTAVHRACASGIMELYGFAPKTPLQRKLEKQEAQRREVEMRRRVREELQQMKEQERKDRNLRMFIWNNEHVREYLYLINSLSNLDESRTAIKTIVDYEGIKKPSEIVHYCKKTSSEIKYVRKRETERSLLHKRLIKDEKFASLFVERGLLPEDDLLLNLKRVQLENCLCLIDNLMDVGWEINIEDSYKDIKKALLDYDRKIG